MVNALAAAAGCHRWRCTAGLGRVKRGHKPAVNQGYWNPKLQRNVERDRAADAALELAGWQVVRLWEHVPLDDAVTAVVTALGPLLRGGDGPGPGPGGPDGHGAA